MLRVLAFGLTLVVFGLAQPPGPAAAACDCKYDANCGPGFSCKINAIQCAGKAATGTCTKIVSDVGRPDPAFANPTRSPPQPNPPSGMTAQ